MLSQRILTVADNARRKFINTVFTRPGTETFDISRLISPMRYDVIVRMEFFEFLRRHQGEPESVIVRLARDEPYRVWFEQLECVRFFPELLHDVDERMRRYDARVRGAMATLTSFQLNGFDPRFPVVLVRVPLGRSADSGAPALSRNHIADGCHRLALLLADGQELEPWMHQVRPATRPLQDNTALLARPLGLDDQTYARFVAPAFLERAQLHTTVSSIADLRSTIALHHPDRLRSFDEVVAAQWLGDPGPGTPDSSGPGSAPARS